MKTEEDNRVHAEAVAHALARSDEYAKGGDVRCRQWKRRARIRRLAALATVMTVVLAMANVLEAAVDNSTHSTGAMSTAENMACTQQMLMQS